MDMRMVSLDDTEIFGGGRGFRPDAAQTLLDSDLTVPLDRRSEILQIMFASLWRARSRLQIKQQNVIGFIVFYSGHLEKMYRTFIRYSTNL